MQLAYNKGISSIRIVVQLYFMEVKRYFPSTDFRCKLFVNKLLVGKFHLLVAILTIQKTVSTLTRCLYSSTSRFSLDEYIKRACE